MILLRKTAIVKMQTHRLSISRLYSIKVNCTSSFSTENTGNGLDIGKHDIPNIARPLEPVLRELEFRYMGAQFDTNELDRKPEGVA